MKNEERDKLVRDAQMDILLCGGKSSIIYCLTSLFTLEDKIEELEAKIKKMEIK